VEGRPSRVFRAILDSWNQSGSVSVLPKVQPFPLQLFRITLAYALIYRPATVDDFYSILQTMINTYTQEFWEALFHAIPVTTEILNRLRIPPLSLDLDATLSDGHKPFHFVQDKKALDAMISMGVKIDKLAGFDVSIWHSVLRSRNKEFFHELAMNCIDIIGYPQCSIDTAIGGALARSLK
jgi:hypothetical protein